MSIQAAAIAKFNQIWVNSGLPSRTVWASFQDSDGLLWFGTGRGVVYYDGYTFTPLIYDTGQFSLSSAVVRNIIQDTSGNIWFGTHENGVVQYSKSKQSFTHYLHNPSQANSLSSNEIRSITYDEKNLWIGTNDGLNQLNLENSEFTVFRHQGKGTNSLPSDVVRALHYATTDYLWVGTDKGLARYHQSSGRFEKINDDSSSHLQILHISQLANSEMLVGTKNGLYTYQKNQNQLILLHPSLKDKGILATAEDKLGNLWIGTLREGLYRIDQRNRVTEYQYVKGNPFSISDQYVLSLTIDSSGSLWAGTFNSGLNWLDLQTLQFEFYDDSEDSLACLTGPVVYSIEKRSNGDLWLGLQEGLAKVELSSGNCTIYTKESPFSQTLPSNQISALLEDSQQNFWVGTGRGLNVLYSDSEMLSAADNNFPTVTVMDLLESSQGVIYAATAKGLYYKNPNDLAFKKARALNDELKNSRTFQVKQDKAGNIFLATNNGLLTLNSEFNLIRPRIKTDIDLYKPIKALHLDQKNRMWIGIDNNGLHIFDTNNQWIHTFDDSSKLKSINGFKSIAESIDGSIWVASSDGLERVIPDSWTITSFNEADGLQSNIYTKNAFFIDNSGKMYFGGRKGLNRFYPSSITTNQQRPKTTITNFTYKNKILTAGDSKQPFTLKKPISETQKLDLSYKDKNFGFEFSALHYANPKQNHYAHKLNNWDTDWQYTSAKHRRVTYNNLPAGNYQFQVKATNNHGVWQKSPTVIDINVAAAPWATPWAYGLYLIALVLSILIFVKYRTRWLEIRSMDLEQSVKIRTQELAAEKQKVEQLLSRKNEEFANVSHEFRTPLTLILGPVAQALKFNKNQQEIDRLNVIQRNGYRLLRMVDQLLHMETFRVKAIARKSPQAVGKIIQLIAHAFVDLAREKNIDFEIGSINNINFEFTPDALEKIILNLLSNAIKYTPTGGWIKISATRSTNDHLIVTIMDSGIGIPTDKLSKVFERYHRVLNEQSERVTGAGIGLSLVKELVTAHNGRVEIDSTVGKGTKVTLTLPIVGEVADVDETQKSNNEIIEMELISLTEQKNTPHDQANFEKSKNNKNPLILIIEDNSDMRQYIADSIQNEYQIITASNGAEGVDLATAEVPDLIISDVMMPEMDGFQATQKLRQHNATSHIPIILLTARGDRESRLKGWHEKADEYLTKPFDVEELKIRLNNLLEIRDILRRRFGEVAFQPINNLESTSIPDENMNQAQEKFITKLNKIIESCYTEPELSIPTIASSIAMSERQLFRKLRSVVDMSPSEYLRRFRLEKAKHLLAEGKSASICAFSTGFSSQSYFGKCFRAQYGVSPSEYKKSIAKNS